MSAAWSTHVLQTLPQTITPHYYVEPLSNLTQGSRLTNMLLRGDEEQNITYPAFQYLPYSWVFHLSFPVRKAVKKKKKRKRKKKDKNNKKRCPDVLLLRLSSGSLKSDQGVPSIPGGELYSPNAPFRDSPMWVGIPKHLPQGIEKARASPWRPATLVVLCNGKGHEKECRKTGKEERGEYKIIIINNNNKKWFINIIIVIISV